MKVGPFTIGRVHAAECLEALGRLPDSCIDTIITDPPYGLGFMGRAWDTFSRERRERQADKGMNRNASPAMNAGTYDHSRNSAFQKFMTVWAREVLRVAKPGAFLLAFGGTRTFHRLTCAIEDAGWEIRDCLLWLYGSGFPKSLDVSKAIDEEAGAERKDGGPKVYSDGTRAHKRGWKDDPRPWMDDKDAKERMSRHSLPATPAAKDWEGWGTALKPAWEPIVLAMKPFDGTFAANAVKHGVAGLNIDGARIEHKTIAGGNLALNPHLRDKIAGGCGGRIFPEEKSRRFVRPHPSGRWPANVILDDTAARQLDAQSGESTSTIGKSRGSKESGKGWGMKKTGAEYNDAGGASRFFYCAKATQDERGSGNDHPTVKPLDVMLWLVRLTATPTGGIVLDPFAGSGTTGVACVLTDRPFLGFEIGKRWVTIGNRRIRKARTGAEVIETQDGDTIEQGSLFSEESE